MCDFCTNRSIQGVFVPETASDLVINLYSRVVAHIVLTNINDLIYDGIRLRLGAGRSLCLVVPALVGILSVLLCLVFLDNWQDVRSDFNELLHICKT